jgi:hypothetical protein
MALDRDIYWIGRQWTVTGLGMQVVDRKKHDFDIEVARLWDDDLIDSLRAEPWFNADDFSKGLALARARYPEPPRKAAPVLASLHKVEPLIEHVLQSVAAVKASAAIVVEPKPRLFAPKFDLHIENSPARFSRTWRVRYGR